MSNSNDIKAILQDLKDGQEMLFLYLTTLDDELNAKIDKGFAGINQSLQTMHDQNVAVFKRLADVEDELNEGSEE